MRSVGLFLGGDVMLGRGIDQILPLRGKPALREPFMDDARDYVELAERVSGSIDRPVAFAYPWGDALDELARAAPDARIINLETSVTSSDEFWPGKAIHYRMHPGNLPSLKAAGIDVCLLANNHVLDFGRTGLLETLDALRGAGLRTAGAGRDRDEAWRSARVELAPTRALRVYGLAAANSGVPPEWAPGASRPGIALLPDLSESSARTVAERIPREKRPGEIVVVSIHWGSNWGYTVPAAHIAFAHRLIDSGADLIHGHSSHHPRPIEVYRDRLVLYGCGDLIDDYEGISGHEEYRGDLKLMYFASLDARGALTDLRMAAMKPRALRLTRAGAEDARWLASTLTRVSASFGVKFEAGEDATIRLHWGSGP
jgi:poly-gamma-glutamate capsule biosynthesis protein CapA/YwtB (metallophosphatase superfamily)